MDDIVGCYKCRYLEYYEKDGFEDSSPEGYYCKIRDVEHFKTFPCNRMLKCFESVPRLVNE